MQVAALKTQYRLLETMLGDNPAPMLFAIALAAGQSFHRTGTTRWADQNEGYQSDCASTHDQAIDHKTYYDRARSGSNFIWGRWKLDALLVLS